MIYLITKSWPDGRAVLLQEAVRKVRTPQGGTVANGDPAGSDAGCETGQQKALLRGYAAVRLKQSGNEPTPGVATRRRATLVRCKTKQETMTRPAESPGWLLPYLEMDAATRRAIVAAEK